MERKLASVQVIKAINSIPNADKIEVVTVLGWQVVVKKGEFSIGDNCVYFEIDSILPRASWNEFLFKHPEDTKFRLKTVRMRGQISQGLVVPMKCFSGIEAVEGLDVTSALSIEKYEPEIHVSLAGDVKSAFPSLIPKTDESRLQSYPALLQEFDDKEVYITQKIDGSSGTFSCIHGEIDVCSRNLSLKRTDGNTFWEINDKYGITNKLLDIYNRTGYSFAIQGEVYGGGIQKNRLGIAGHDFAAFTVFDIDNHRRLDYAEFVDFCKTLEIPVVPVLYVGVFKWKTVDEMLEFAKGKYKSGKDQEGIVIRPIKNFRSDILNSTASFKVINNDFLEKGGE